MTEIIDESDGSRKSLLTSKNYSEQFRNYAQRKYTLTVEAEMKFQMWQNPMFTGWAVHLATNRTTAETFAYLIRSAQSQFHLCASRIYGVGYGCCDSSHPQLLCTDAIPSMSVTISGDDRVQQASGVWQDSSSTFELPKTAVKQDAGLRSLDHCMLPLPYFHFRLTILPDKNRLPTWRHVPRQKLLPLVRWETPYLAMMQNKMRSPALDSYFSITANLGTHTFFMVVLPILFWCGYTSLGRGYVHT